DNLLKKMAEYLENENSKEQTISQEFQHKKLMDNLHVLAEQPLNESKYQKEQIESIQLLKEIVEKGTTGRDDKFVIRARLNNALKAMNDIKRHNLDDLENVIRTGMKVLRQDYLKQQEQEPAADRLAKQNIIKAKLDSMAGNNVELNSYVEDLFNTDS